MYACMYVGMYVGILRKMYILTYVCMYFVMHACTYHVCMYVRMNVFVYISETKCKSIMNSCMHICKSSQTHNHLSAFMYTCMYYTCI